MVKLAALAAIGSSEFNRLLGLFFQVLILLSLVGVVLLEPMVTYSVAKFLRFIQPTTSPTWNTFSQPMSQSYHSLSHRARFLSSSSLPSRLARPMLWTAWMSTSRAPKFQQGNPVRISIVLRNRSQAIVSSATTGPQLLRLIRGQRHGIMALTEVRKNGLMHDDVNYYLSVFGVYIATPKLMGGVN